NPTMKMLSLPAFWVEPGAIIWINLLVSGDNAAMIALAARLARSADRRGAVRDCMRQMEPTGN
ncbi:MAG: hypothetical protein HW392_1501, partial [Steroidobacteraceae bacterium]|nr:hypothetical protein [Steroidobacteraceae bacterium]